MQFRMLCLSLLFAQACVAFADTPDIVDVHADFPDRPMLGSDAFYDPSGSIFRGSSEQGMQNLRRLIDALPGPVRAAVASGNAERVYRLTQTPPLPQ